MSKHASIPTLRRDYGPQGSDRFTGYKISPIESKIRHLLVNNGTQSREPLEEFLREYGIWTDTRDEFIDVNSYTDSKPTWDRVSNILQDFKRGKARYDFANVYITDSNFSPVATDHTVIPLNEELESEVTTLRNRDGGDDIIFTAPVSLVDTRNTQPVDLTDKQTKQDLQFDFPETILCTIKYNSHSSAGSASVKKVKPFVPCGPDESGITCGCAANIFHNILSDSHNPKFFLCKHEFVFYMLFGDGVINPNFRHITTPEYVNYLDQLSP